MTAKAGNGRAEGGDDGGMLDSWLESREIS